MEGPRHWRVRSSTCPRTRSSPRLKLLWRGASLVAREGDAFPQVSPGATLFQFKPKCWDVSTCQLGFQFQTRPRYSGYPALHVYGAEVLWSALEIWSAQSHLRFELFRSEDGNCGSMAWVYPITCNSG